MSCRIYLLDFIFHLLNDDKDHNHNFRERVYTVIVRVLDLGKVREINKILKKHGQIVEISI